VTTCNCQSTCSCGTQAITVQVASPTVISVVTPGTQSTQSTVVVKPGQGGSRGPQGVQGAQGIQGIQGISREIAYRHSQGTADVTWRITHNLNFYPNVTTMDSTGAICEGEIVYTNPNYLEITFLAAFSGVAYLS